MGAVVIMFCGCLTRSRGARQPAKRGPGQLVFSGCFLFLFSVLFSPRVFIVVFLFVIPPPFFFLVFLAGFMTREDCPLVVHFLRLVDSLSG